MNKNRKPYPNLQKASAIFMIFALLWLTISAPFVNASEMDLDSLGDASQTELPMSGNDEDGPSPINNTTEEKAPTNSSSFSEEYLHSHDKSEHFFSSASQYHKCENADTYNAFHGELLVPPPNCA